MKQVFRLAAAILATGIATEAAAGRLAAKQPVAVPLIVMAPIFVPQTYLPASDAQRMPTELTSGFNFENNICHKELQPFADKLTAFRKVKKFCDSNAKAALQLDKVLAAASTQLSYELTGLTAAVKRDKSYLWHDFNAYQETKAERQDYVRTVERHAHAGKLAADMARKEYELTVANASQAFSNGINVRFGQIFPYGVRVMPLPQAATIVLGP